VSRARIALVALALVVLAHYGLRAAVAALAAPHYVRGRHLAAQGRYDAALPQLERGAIGGQRPETRWLTAQVRIGIWQNKLWEGASAEEVEPQLVRAFAEYTEAIAASPATGWYWASLGDLYHQRERQMRYESGVPLESLRWGPWGRVGRAGRVAIGLMRLGIELEPTAHHLRDQLAFTLYDYGLDDLALEAVRESARVLPDYSFHSYDQLDPLPEGLLEAFADASREALGHTPLLRRTLALIALGRMDLRLGRLEQAERDLLGALDAPGDRLNRAEAHYYLGLVLMRQERWDEAAAHLVAAERHPNFESPAVAARAALAERRGDLRAALDLLARARRLRPGQVSYALDYARVALALGETPRAEQALKWANQVDPADWRARRDLVRLYLDAGRLAEARTTLDSLRGVWQAAAEVRRLDAELAERGGP